MSPWWHWAVAKSPGTLELGKAKVPWVQHAGDFLQSPDFGKRTWQAGMRTVRLQGSMRGPSTFGWGSRHSIQGTKSTPHRSAPHPSHRTSRPQEASPGSMEVPSPSGSNLSTPTKLLPGTGQGWRASRKGMALVSCAWLVPNSSLGEKTREPGFA